MIDSNFNFGSTEKQILCYADMTRNQKYLHDAKWKFKKKKKTGKGYLTFIWYDRISCMEFTQSEAVAWQKKRDLE